MALYQVGQNIVYGNIGVCRVEAVGRMQFTENSPREYYTLRPVFAKDGDKIYVPVDANVPMRTTLTREEALAYIEEMKAVAPELFFAQNQTTLAAHYQEMMQPHSVTQNMKIMKEICQKEKALKQKGRHLNGVDQHFYKMVEQLLSEEFALALEETPAAAKEQLHAAALS